MLEADSGNPSDFLRRSPSGLRKRPAQAIYGCETIGESKRKEAGIRTELDIEIRLYENLRKN